MEEKEEQTFEITKLVPHAITMAALCLGLFSVRFSMAHSYANAAICIMVAALLDAFDGKIARKLGVSSDFGAQMDSLADFFNFGIAPGFLVYFWKMSEYTAIKGLSWMPVLLLAMAMAIRLARFNVDLGVKDQNDPIVKYFFRGMPAPMAAVMVMFPLMLAMEYPMVECFRDPLAIIINTIFIAFMAGSTIPTITPKKMKIKSEYKPLVLMLFATVCVCLFTNLWITLAVICIVYAISIVAGWFYYYKLLNQRK